MDIVLIIGRVLFALLFISSGVSHLTKLEAMTGYAQYKKVPAAKFSVVLSGLMILVGGLYIFLIPTSFLMHAFWKETDATAKQNESIGFFKNLSLAGAALIIFALVATGTEFGPSVTGAFFNL
jgi:uncharacterized membrane protein YphA (DoxX/SURF4 family)